MTDIFLRPGLHDTADAVKAFLANERGVTKIRMEETIDPRVLFKPTLSGKILGGLVCVEVSETFFPATLDSFVTDCLAHGLPVKLFVACPASPTGKIDQSAISRAANLGVGCLLVTDGAVTVIREANDLSLFIESPKVSVFTGPFREAVANAFATYMGGNPAKGLGALCDTIELVIRRVAIWAKKKGIIPPANNLNLETGPLHNVIQVLMKYHVLADALLGKCLGMTEFRNASSHPPLLLSALVRRNTRLKNNFLYSLQLLEDLLASSKGRRR